MTIKKKKQQLKINILSSCHIQSQDQDFLAMCFPLSLGSKAAFYEFGSQWLKDKFNRFHQHPQHLQDPVTKGQQRHCTVPPSWQWGKGRTTRAAPRVLHGLQGMNSDSQAEQSVWVSPLNCKDTLD